MEEDAQILKIYRIIWTEGQIVYKLLSNGIYIDTADVILLTQRLLFSFIASACGNS